MRRPVLGVDVGSVSVALVLLSPAREILQSRYDFHQGLIRETLRKLLAELPLEGLGAVACTGSMPGLLRAAEPFDSQLCQLASARHLHGRPGSLLVVGGERFGLFTFDPEGGFLSLKANSSCAAGTGSFLDQQARRLGLAGSAELGRKALANRGQTPAIASRCSVFAKTDLCHAQQAGYSLEEICDGLCLGLARNIADTVGGSRGGSSGGGLNQPAVFAGGVSRNPAVVRHLEALLGSPLSVDACSHLYGALGAALCRLESPEDGGVELPLLLETEAPKSYFHPPLSLRLSSYPDFSRLSGRLFAPRVVRDSLPVEVDLYAPLGGEGILGIDIGSTSTKAVLLALDRRVLAGFYTRTAGRPLTALRAILEALQASAEEQDAGLKLRAVGATGAGRKYVGQVIGADLIMNEITAHARAACALNPQTDTIIEIGGQDSKFTVLRGGQVTFAQMNTVCAAGTGSFLEEQAARLGVSLEEYSRRAEGVCSPLASDRCTVFMERDINHYLARKYTVEEILAAALHAVRENYLLKVASSGLIGKTVCFQGATAKNRALVAGFEQRLGRPIFVSQYCHLTGALGVALALAEELPARSSFRGIRLYEEEIPVRTEGCTLCANRCRLSVAEVLGETVAYGFQCGRDYGTQRFVRRNPSAFDLLAERRRLASRSASPPPASSVRIGLPAALQLFEELPLWERFFSELGIATLSSAGYAEGLAGGREIAGAEFCAPVTELHGHARHLAERCDAVFLPVYLRSGDSGRVFCYYTQFASAVVAVSQCRELAGKSLLPLIDRSRPGRTARELWKALRPLLPGRLSVAEVAAGYAKAQEFQRSYAAGLQALYRRESCGGDIRVVLAGRPYVVLSPAMNKGIPEMFASLGVKAFFQDMIPAEASAEVGELLEEIRPLREAFHWHFAARILEAAAYCARTPGVYPVLVTSFKCSPDSFLIEYFKRLLDSHGKPYLILQIDDHASNVGYETRIEAGVHSFRNHFAARAAERPVPPRRAAMRLPEVERRLDGKTLLLPNWDALSMPLLAAAMQRRGIDARVLEESELSIQKAMRWNTGQCIPLNAIVQDFAEYVERRGLDPERTALWMPQVGWACNIPLFPYYIKSLLEHYGQGLERARVYRGRFFNEELSPLLALETGLAFHFGGLLRRAGCRLRPYELAAGETDRAIGAGEQAFLAAFRGERTLEGALAEAMGLFESVARREGQRPKVAIFGDLYVRDNEVLNQGLIRTIEEAGGEVVTTPLSDYLRITAQSNFLKDRLQGNLPAWLKHWALLAASGPLERRFYPYYRRYLPGAQSFRNPRLAEDLERFRVKLEQGGESYDNILKILHLLRTVPDISLFVQANPAFCCPSLVTEAMAWHIEQVTGVPVVTLTYDGTGRFKNDRLLPYLRYPRRGRSS
jgi:predicted CoA-substrate-specific enzyme activase